MSKKVSGKARGARMDAAEAWLAENDPEYAKRKKGWQVATTDALSRIMSEVNEEHPSLEGLDRIVGSPGGYRRRSLDFSSDLTSYSEEDALEDDYSEDSYP